MAVTPRQTLTQEQYNYLLEVAFSTEYGDDVVDGKRDVDFASRRLGRNWIDISPCVPTQTLRGNLVGCCGLLVTLFIAASAFASEPASAAEPTYSYELEVNSNPDVCNHMLGVFNKQFRNLWEANALGIGDDPNYSASSRYAFPRLPGVEHNTRMTFDMRYSKVPSSPEFDAIQWMEGRRITGGPPLQESSSSSKMPQPFLSSYIDFDNDGQLDTVVKNGFSRGYRYMANDRTVGLLDEYLYVWRGQEVGFAHPQSMWDLVGGSPISKWPITSNATYIRPFVYKGRTYSAQFDMDIGEGGIAMRTPPYRPTETMSVLDFRFTGETSEFTKAPVWTVDTVCRYAMIQINPGN